jgi:hypothetical protein
MSRAATAAARSTGPLKGVACGGRRRLVRSHRNIVFESQSNAIENKKRSIAAHKELGFSEMLSYNRVCKSQFRVRVLRTAKNS